MSVTPFKPRKRVSVDGWFTAEAGKWGDSSLAEEWSRVLRKCGDGSTKDARVAHWPLSAGVTSLISRDRGLPGRASFVVPSLVWCEPCAVSHESLEPGTLGDSSTQGQGTRVPPAAAQGCLAPMTERSTMRRGGDGPAGQTGDQIPGVDPRRDREARNRVNQGLAGIKPGRRSVEPSRRRYILSALICGAFLVMALPEPYAYAVILGTSAGLLLVAALRAFEALR